MAENELREPWLIAVWPGMGNVALGAGSYLVSKLEASLVAELPARDLFDVQHIDVKDGVSIVGRLPRSLFFEYRSPEAQRDLLLFIGEAQPPTHGYTLCHKILDYATRRGVKRIFTFAAMATQLHPSSTPRVLGVTTEKRLLGELNRLEVTVLEEGQITGLNGVLLAAASERGLEGYCLMGELPFFAVGVPNPRASQAVLEAFCTMAGLRIDLADLEAQAGAVERYLLELLKKLTEAGGGALDEETVLGIEPVMETDAGPGIDLEPPVPNPELGPPPEYPTPRKPIDAEAREHIEEMFDRAAHAAGDRSKAMELKHELDRLGVFEEYEDRFLDLFKRAE